MGKRFQKQCNSMFCWTEKLSDEEAAEESYVKKETTQPSPVKPKAPRKSKVEAVLTELDKMYESMIAAIVRLRRRFKVADRDNAEVRDRYICDQSKTKQNDRVDKKVKVPNAPDIAEYPTHVTIPLPKVCKNQNEGQERCSIESYQSDVNVKQYVDTLDESASVQSLPNSSIKDIDDVGSIPIFINGDDDNACEDLQNEDSVKLPTNNCNPNGNQFQDNPSYIPPGLDLQLLDKRLEKLYYPPKLDDLLDQLLHEVVIKERRKQHVEIKKREFSPIESQSPGESTCTCISSGFNESRRTSQSLGESPRIPSGLNESTRIPQGLNESTRIPPDWDESTRIPPGLDLKLLEKRIERSYNPPAMDDMLDQLLEDVVITDRRKQHTELKKTQFNQPTNKPPGLDLELLNKRLDNLCNPPTLDDLLDQVLEEVAIKDRRKPHAEITKKQPSLNKSQFPGGSLYIPPSLDRRFLDKRVEKLCNPPTLDDLLDQVLEEVVIKERKTRHTGNKKKQDESVFKFCRLFDEDIGNAVLDDRGF